MRHFDELIFNGAKPTNGTINNDDAVNAGGGLVTIPITAHGLKVGSMIHIAGSVAYNGNYVLQAVAVNSITVKATYVAETFAGTETFVSGWKMPCSGWIAGIVAKLSAGAGKSELMYINIDAQRGADFDFSADSHDFNTVTNWAEMYGEGSRFPFEVDDILMVTFANTTDKTFGVRLFLDRN
jgi:hypothetical protein